MLLVPAYFSPLVPPSAVDGTFLKGQKLVHSHIPVAFVLGPPTLRVAAYVLALGAELVVVVSQM